MDITGASEALNPGSNPGRCAIKVIRIQIK